MIRKIIKIDEEKCNGCGACASACHEGAIEMINGKAKLTREDYCDGLGDCLPACPTGAILLKKERRLLITKRRFLKRSRIKNRYLAVVRVHIQKPFTENPVIRAIILHLLTAGFHSGLCKLNLSPLTHHILTEQTF